MSGINLIGLTRSELRNFAESIDEKSYRGDQIFLGFINITRQNFLK